MNLELGWKGREIPSAWRETSASDKFSTPDPAWVTLILNPELRSEKPAANRLMCGRVIWDHTWLKASSMNEFIEYGTALQAGRSRV